jgi:cell division protein FtsQ
MDPVNAGKMSTGPEVYPPEALADDEPRYLRRQKPLEIRRRKFGKKSWPAYRRWTLIAAGILTAGFLGYEGVRFLLFSPSVEFADLYQVEITGSQFVGRAAVTDVFTPDLGKSILRVPLDARRKEIESIPWVQEAAVQRTLPDRIRVELLERTPVAFLRTGNELQLVDGSGVLLERPLEASFHFPVVSGFDEATPLAERKQRMSLFVDFMKEIELAHAGAGEEVSEVDFSDAQDVRAMLAGLPGLEGQYPIWVHFGNSDFVNKYGLLNENVAQWRASAGRVESIDLRFAKQVVVNPEHEPAPAKPVEAAVRSAGSAGARRSPNGRSN